MKQLWYLQESPVWCGGDGDGEDGMSDDGRGGDDDNTIQYTIQKRILL